MIQFSSVQFRVPIVGWYRLVSGRWHLSAPTALAASYMNCVVCAFED